MTRRTYDQQPPAGIGAPARRIHELLNRGAPRYLDGAVDRMRARDRSEVASETCSAKELLCAGEQQALPRGASRRHERRGNIDCGPFGIGEGLRAYVGAGARQQQLLCGSGIGEIEACARSADFDHKTVADPL